MCVADLEPSAPLDFILEINLFLVAACEFYLGFIFFFLSFKVEDKLWMWMQVFQVSCFSFLD